MTHGRKRLSTVLTAAAALAATLAISLVPMSPTFAEPDIDEVQGRVDRLYHQAEEAQERWHDANLELSELKRDLAALQADQRRQEEQLELVQDEVEQSVVRQYEGESLTAVGEVVVSDDPSALLGQLTTMSAYNDLQADLFDDYAVELKALQIRKQATSKRTSEVAAVEAQMAKEKKAVDAKLAEAKELLARLKEEERQAILSRGTSRIIPSTVPASGRAAVAVRTALAQVGDSYVYGAMGPDAFDCSGLTMYAWGAAGVGLPHSSSAQFGSGPRIAASALQPGDLVFYYSPISHVGMYIGNGLIVHAANPGTDVVVSGLYSMPYVGAVRPG
ncbi:C40 family peptidase [Nocardioides bigeumensis]|uniref:C40 family peptidase n=1 Tax=Nocardioides bigeumensis TaxID=433657 RepID=A0ABN2XWX0_9ACTN